MSRTHRRRGGTLNILLLLFAIGVLQVASGTQRGAEVGWGLITAVLAIGAAIGIGFWIAWRLGWRPWGHRHNG